MGTTVPQDEPYESGGRSRQKARTRAALVAAARSLLADGLHPTVEAAADRAEISRTTAYRYFPNRRALLAATYPELEEPSLLEDDGPSGAADRLDAVIASFTRQLLEHEPELRAQLRLALDPGEAGRDMPLRKGRAVRWIEDALSPLRGRVPDDELRRLVLAIRATLGIEALVWLTDVGGASREEATEIMAASARTLLASRAPMTVELFAGVRVRDVAAARPWYEQLLGEPSFFPNPTEVVWTIADGRSLYIEEDPGRAGSGLVTLFVDDLDSHLAEIATRGLGPDTLETYSNGVRKATFRDDDGNEIGLGGT